MPLICVCIRMNPSCFNTHGQPNGNRRFSVFFVGEHTTSLPNQRFTQLNVTGTSPISFKEFYCIRSPLYAQITANHGELLNRSYTSVSFLASHVANSFPINVPKQKIHVGAHCKSNAYIMFSPLSIHFYI